MRWIELIVVSLFILLTLSSAVHAEVSENNYSYDGPNEGFFFGLYGDLINAILSIPKLILGGALHILYVGANLSIYYIKYLLIEPAPVSSFYHLWKVIVSVLSTLFVLIFTFCGLYLIVSGGEEPEKRNRAKEWLKQSIIMIIVIPLSFLIYQFIIDIASTLTNIMMSYVSTDFLYIGEGTINNLSLEIGFGVPYTIAAYLAVILLTIRYMFVCIGTLFFPIGLMFYFIPLTKEYGKVILTFILLNIFSTFFIAIFLAVYSVMSSSGFLSDLQILLACGALIVVDIFLIYIMFFATLKALFNGAKTVMAVVGTAQFFGL